MKLSSVTISSLFYILLGTEFSVSKKSSSGKRIVIGIDLGTTYSCVGLMKEVGSLEILTNEFGNRITPSFVSFDDNGERFIGDEALRKLISNPKNTFFDAKRFIGREWTDPFVQEIKDSYPFDIIEYDGKLVFEVRTKAIRRFFTPEEISAMILGKMKTIAEEYLGEPVEDCVITVPAYFNDAQRSSTRDAGAIAGLNVLRILNEPTAAALAFGYGIKGSKELSKRVIVYDLGGGTFDVSLLKIYNGNVEVLSTTGDSQLGGRDFDNAVVEYLLRHYIRETGHIEVRDDIKALEKLRLEVETAKRVLTTYKTARIEIEAFYNGMEYSTTLTREKFNELNMELFKSTLTKLDQVLEDSELTVKDVSDVVLVGGSTRIPMIQQLVKEYFNKEPRRDINPDEAVVTGAIIQGHMLIGGKGSEDMHLIDVVPLSIGMETKGGIFDKIVHRNTRIPHRATQDYTTTFDNQEGLEIKIYEGERSLTADNNLLGSFVISGIQPAPRGVPNIQVEISINSNGIVTVKATDTKSQNSKSRTLSNDRRLRSDEIDRMIDDAKIFLAKDKEREGAIRTKNQLEEFITSIKDITNEGDNEDNYGKFRLTSDQKKVLREAIERVNEWLETNQEATKEKYKTILSQIEKRIKKFLENIGLSLVGNMLRTIVNETHYFKDEL